MHEVRASLLVFQMTTASTMSRVVDLSTLTDMLISPLRNNPTHVFNLKLVRLLLDACWVSLIETFPPKLSYSL